MLPTARGLDFARALRLGDAGDAARVERLEVHLAEERQLVEALRRNLVAALARIEQLEARRSEARP